jgi:hypothetical protein
MYRDQLRSVKAENEIEKIVPNRIPKQEETEIIDTKTENQEFR